jgi:phosphopantothenoylcysteine decarboxylase/phosphopantothenate--cysteine ligase
MTAAVADYRPKFKADQKIKKTEGPFVIEMERTKDILLEMSKRKQSHHTFIGFAAETEHLLENARRKLQQKKLDWIIANDVSNPEIGFGSDKNAVTVIGQKRRFSLPVMSKKKLAAAICKLF